MSTKPPASVPSSVRIAPAEDVDQDALCALYDAVGWSTYTHEPTQLLAAIRGSDFLVTAVEGDLLIGLARAISDDSSIAYVQDILVRPTHQGQGVGRLLLTAVLDRYKHVRQKVLLTDDRPEQLQFYASMGFKNTRDLTKTPLNAFVIIEGASLG
ncbi:MAG TPA: GNAT family N-acetyltransferase [Deltaproteobacteria bacterium]|nr:GNAT family N-acetyltransferase [Deltaproteobacteria bacterium]HCP44790.1 GNAT family N-acetyltransferase [Deltaproteobacteria bacterium]